MASSSRSSGRTHSPEIPNQTPEDASSPFPSLLTLATSSIPVSLSTGTGFSVYSDTIIPLILSARRSIILTTCFWASSATQEALRAALLNLSSRIVSDPSARHITVYLCFSSSSLAQNLLNPPDKNGYTYQDTEWPSLGLPRKEDVPGLKMSVRRKFYWPFGIWHSKYAIIDGRIAVMPSANVSWERWLEVGVMMKGQVVTELCQFHENFWGLSEDMQTLRCDGAHRDDYAPNFGPTHIALLPSPHRPGLPAYVKSFFDLCACNSRNQSDNFPQTPLLTTTAKLLSTAKRNILLFTPNLTSATVFDLLSQALARGVEVQIFTNKNLMTAEQLVTAGITTPRFIAKLQRHHKNLSKRGRLSITYFEEIEGKVAADAQATAQELEKTPVKLHAKITIVDGESVLLGSGNMDAASWGTSQELGVLVKSVEVASALEKAMSAWRCDASRFHQR